MTISSLSENRFYVYILRRPDKIDHLDPEKGQPFYVGKGSNGRMRSHRKEARYLLESSKIKCLRVRTIHKLWQAGLDFTEEILFDNLTEEEAFKVEKETIALYGRRNLEAGCLSNMTDGGNGPAGIIPWNIGVPRSDEVKQKLREANLGKTYPKEVNKKKGRPGRQCWNKGKTGVMSAESNQKRRDAQKGIPLSEEVKAKMRGRVVSAEGRKKISDGLKGRIFSEDHRRHLSERQRGEKHYLFGKHHSEETKQKLREANKGKVMSEESRRKMSLAKKGKPLSEDHRKNLSNANKGKEAWNKGKKGLYTHSEEIKKKISDGHKKRKRETEIARPVI